MARFQLRLQRFNNNWLRLYRLKKRLWLRCFLNGSHSFNALAFTYLSFYLFLHRYIFYQSFNLHINSYLSLHSIFQCLLVYSSVFPPSHQLCLFLSLFICLPKVLQNSDPPTCLPVSAPISSFYSFHPLHIWLLYLRKPPHTRKNIEFRMDCFIQVSSHITLRKTNID